MNGIINGWPCVLMCECIINEWIHVFMLKMEEAFQRTTRSGLVCQLLFSFLPLTDLLQLTPASNLRIKCVCAWVCVCVCVCRGALVFRPLVGAFRFVAWVWFCRLGRVVDLVNRITNRLRWVLPLVTNAAVTLSFLYVYIYIGIYKSIYLYIVIV